MLVGPRIHASCRRGCNEKFFPLHLCNISRDFALSVAEYRQRRKIDCRQFKKNLTAHPPLRRFRVKELPTIIVVHDGQEAQRLEGRVGIPQIRTALADWLQ